MYSFFEGIFYLMVFVTLYYEVCYFTQPQTILDWKIYLLSKKELKIDEENAIKPTTANLIVTFLALIATVTDIIGLASSQWFLFLLYFIISLISYLLGSMFKKYKLSIIGISIDGFFCTCIVLSIILNKYHFHCTAVDVYNYLTK